VQRAIDFGFQELLPRTKNSLSTEAPNLLPPVPLALWERIPALVDAPQHLPGPEDDWYPQDNMPIFTLSYADMIHGLENLVGNHQHDFYLDCAEILKYVLCP
jgi:hypothetical protein